MWRNWQSLLNDKASQFGGQSKGQTLGFGGMGDSGIERVSGHQTLCI